MSYTNQSHHVVHHNKPNLSGYQEPKGFQDLSTYSWEKGHITILGNFWTHCSLWRALRYPVASFWRGYQRQAPQVNKSFFSSFFFSNCQILAYNASFRLHQGYLVTSREMWLPGKVWLPGKMTSRKIPGKFVFPGNLSSLEIWLPGKWDFLGNKLLPGKYGKSVSSQET